MLVNQGTLGDIQKGLSSTVSISFTRTKKPNLFWHSSLFFSAHREASGLRFTILE